MSQYKYYLLNGPPIHPISPLICLKIKGRLALFVYWLTYKYQGVNQDLFYRIEQNPFIRDKLIEMHSFSTKAKSTNPHHPNTKNNKIQHICYLCSKLKQQVRNLKAIQQKLSKQIHQIITFVPKQIESIVGKIRKTAGVSSSQISQTKSKLSSVNNKLIPRHPSPQSQSAYECQLKAQDSSIKQSISKQLKMIRVLETKQKDIRLTNEKLQTLRKSLSKQSIPSQLKKTPNKPSSVRNIDSVIVNQQNRGFKGQIQTEQNEWINSPKFGRSNQITFQQNWRYSSQDSKPKSNKLNSEQITISNKQRPFSNKNEGGSSSNQQKTQYQVLRCPNGHECYRGDTLNNIPHGGGTLINCCSKMPFKVNPKTLKYTGSFSFGQFEGRGVLICKDNVKFQGTFLKGLRQGQGIIYLQGSGERGVWEQDKLVSFM